MLKNNKGGGERGGARKRVIIARLYVKAAGNSAIKTHRSISVVRYRSGKEYLQNMITGRVRTQQVSRHPSLVNLLLLRHKIGDSRDGIQRGGNEGHTGTSCRPQGEF